MQWKEEGWRTGIELLKCKPEDPVAVYILDELLRDISSDLNRLASQHNAPNIHGIGTNEARRARAVTIANIPALLALIDVCLALVRIVDPSSLP